MSLRSMWILALLTMFSVHGGKERQGHSDGGGKKEKEEERQEREI